MRILLDECVNQRLRKSFPNHEVQSAQYAGLNGLKNGDLLNAAEVLLTVDRGFEYEQNLSKRKIAVVIFLTQSIAYEELSALVPTCLIRLESIQPGEIVTIVSDAA